MSLKRLKAIVFDFDGTLARPELSFEEMNRASIEAVAALMPEFPPKEEPALEWLEKVYVAASRLRGEAFAQEVLRQADMAMAEVEVAAVKRGGLFPETREILKKLVNSNVKTGIVTRNCRKAVLTALPDLEKLCSCLLSRDDISKWKPDPVHLRTALELMRVAPEEALMVGDDPMDIKVGKECNTSTAAVLCGHASKEKLLSCMPDFIAADCADLLGLLADKKLIELY